MKTCTGFLLSLFVSSWALAQPMGDVYPAGTTWYDWQHNGSCQRMISVDTMGYVHVAWTKGLDETNDQRHVFYNVWDPVTQSSSSGQSDARLTRVIAPVMSLWPARRTDMRFRQCMRPSRTIRCQWLAATFSRTNVNSPAQIVPMVSCGRT